MAVAHCVAVNEAVVAVKVIGLKARAPNFKATSFARAGVGEAVNDPATTNKTPKVAGMRGNLIWGAPSLLTEPRSNEG